VIAATAVRTWELDRTPDLVDLVSAARDRSLVLRRSLATS